MGRNYYDINDSGVQRWSEIAANNPPQTKVAELPSYESWKEAKESPRPEQVRVLTFNIAVDGRFGLDGVTELIRSSNADIIGLQESGDSAKKIAASLGMKLIQTGKTTILTSLDVESSTPGGNGIIVKTEGGKNVAFFNRHLYHAPYQPYQVLGIPYENGRFVSTEADAIDEANKARGKDVEEVRKDIAEMKDQGLPTIVVGDFNEPSYLDWTDETVKAGRHPFKVEWPATKSLADDGFKDSYREMHPDPVKNPGYTWTPTTKIDDPKDHHDRIDFILYRGASMKVKSVDIIGEDVDNADIPFTPFPSDHRAVTAVFEVGDARP